MEKKYTLWYSDYDKGWTDVGLNLSYDEVIKELKQELLIGYNQNGMFNTSAMKFKISEVGDKDWLNRLPSNLM